jgi:putative ABC transport system substrate-binding protein
LPVHIASGADQPPKVPRIGFLAPGVTDGDQIPQWMQKLGYVEGKNIAFEFRSAHGKPERVAELAAELVRLKVDVIVAFTNVAAFAARDATKTIPIVVYGAHGALQTGLVRSLGRPGGNLTGVESLAPELDAKRLELLKELVPGLSHLAVLYNAGDQGAPFHLKSTQTAGRALRITVAALEVRRPFRHRVLNACGQAVGWLADVH